MTENNNRKRVLVIGVANFKGGAGKTVIAIMLAKAFAELGLRVVLIDEDKNLTAKNWSRRRDMDKNRVRDPQTEFVVLDPRQAQNYMEPRDIVIFDTPGGMTSSDAANLAENTSFIVVPCRADLANIDATEAIANDIEKAGGKYKVLITNAINAGKFARARDLLNLFEKSNVPHFGELNRHGIPQDIIPSSMKFVDAADSGKTIGEISGGGLFARTFTNIAEQILLELGYNREESIENSQARQANN